VGECIDGGAVNNAPISCAIDAGVDRVIVVSGNPVHEQSQGSLAGGELIGEVVDIAINERLFRDLLTARKVNKKLAAVGRALEDVSISDAERAAVLGALGWKPLQIVEIRPEQPLRGNAFAALGNGDLRREYIGRGREAAEQALGSL
jgi:predicted acylesterase/phospholipase RssA